MEFIKFPSIARYSRDCIITEKIDGTNAQICITEDGQFLTGSRSRWITPHKQWCLTEIAKIILEDEYEEWASGDDEYEAWDEGVAP